MDRAAFLCLRVSVQDIDGEFKKKDGGVYLSRGPNLVKQKQDKDLYVRESQLKLYLLTWYYHDLESGSSTLIQHSMSFHQRFLQINLSLFSVLRCDETKKED